MTDRAEGMVAALGHSVAGADLDVELAAIPGVSSLGEEGDLEGLGLMGKNDRQCLHFTVVDVERAAGMTYRVGIGVGLGLVFPTVGGGVIGVGWRDSSRIIAIDGGSIDRDGEDSGDDGEELCREHHDAS